MNLQKIRFVMYLIAISGMASSYFVSAAGATATGDLTSTLCGIINAIGLIIGILALMLFILGGVLYAVAHFLPAAGNLRAGMQGWGMGMLVAGVVALILYILAPHIIEIIVGFQSGTGAPQLTGTGYGASC